MADAHDESRRDLLGRVPVIGAGLVLIASGQTGLAQEETAEGKEEEISPAEDLMREHGVLSRILLVYEEAIRRLAGRDELPPEALQNAATIVRTFVEDYHEKLEEEFLFPRFEKANQHVELVKTLRTQHEAGRRLTDQIRGFAKRSAMQDQDDRRKLSDSLRLFVRMYRPHGAREDTVLFPAFRKIVSPNEYDSLGEQFEDREHRLFGEEGFDKMVDKVAAIEKKLGIHDLAQFTPR